MTWKSFHRRGDVLRTVIEHADRRRDGILPVDVEGVSDTFADELDLIGALQLRWHARLSGQVERELMTQPMDLESAVVAAWCSTARQLPGLRAIIDRQRTEPLDAATAQALQVATTKEHVLLAVMAGRASDEGPSAARIGARIEATARERLATPTAVMSAGHRAGPAERTGHGSFLDRVLAALTAA